MSPLSTAFRSAPTGRRRSTPLLAALALTGAALSALPVAQAARDGGALPVPRPHATDFAYVGASETPPDQAQCASVGRRCFGPQALQNAYNLGPLHAKGQDGRGRTIAIVDAFGYDQAEADLKVYSQQFGLPLMCGMPGVACKPGMPTFSRLKLGDRPVTEPPSGSNGTGQEDSNGWALEVALDVDMAHAMAPGANIVLVSTPTAETLGTQGFPQFMDLEQQVVDGGMADVISQSFGSGEEAFHSTASLENLRHAFKAAAAKGVTVLASSGDDGSENGFKTPVKNPAEIPYASVGWPASDPLVTGVGGTYLCLDGATGTHVDSTSAPASCGRFPGQREIGWTFAGGGFSHVFSKPAYQNTLPAGSTPIGSMRGVPDIAAQASSATGVLVRDTAPGATGIKCPSGDPCSSGWYVVGGTSSSAPQWAGMVAVADQIAGHRLGQINQSLYDLSNGPNYGAYFFDVTTGNNSNPDYPNIPGYPATQGWDPITGLGTPNAAALLPALAAHS
ncbi:S53 family peptidase [Actinomadura rupiterrae]|uniref:S53 family peptidase n=1 Tax=Actinomadura rupiterrae TaxID=559627 RepID=UPI0020A3ACF2|nr:S53 family peptidase [Actinomadura rupiterrae]MCP2334718.1 subtilase family serine protease [Actinomadura rupiterrae]